MLQLHLSDFSDDNRSDFLNNNHVIIDVRTDCKTNLLHGRLTACSRHFDTGLKKKSVDSPVVTRSTAVQKVVGSNLNHGGN